MSRLLARLQRAELERQAKAAVRRALQAPDPAERRAAASAGGEPDAMRGVPILGRGIGGAIKGTRPGEGGSRLR
jgi:hypothetical protein